MQQVSVMISQPRYLPACNYIKRMSMSDVFVYLDCVQYTKRDFENRNRILTPSGPMWLTVPVIHTSSEQRIFETRIDWSSDWRKSHLSSIFHSYKKCARFDEIYQDLEKIYIHKYEYLMDLNSALTDYFIAKAGIKSPRIEKSTALLGGEPHPKGQELLLKICEKLGASQYISGPNGREYITSNYFESAGVGLFFHDYKCAPYDQANFKGDFQQYMGIVDLYMNCENDEIIKIIDGV